MKLGRMCEALKWGAPGSSGILLVRCPSSTRRASKASNAILCHYRQQSLTLHYKSASGRIERHPTGSTITLSAMSAERETKAAHNKTIPSAKTIDFDKPEKVSSILKEAKYYNCMSCKIIGTSSYPEAIIKL